MFPHLIFALIMSSSKSVVFGLTWMIMMMMLLQGCRSCIESERQGLLELKAYMISVITDPHLDIRRGWMSSDRSCCHWKRIKCDSTSKRVIGISLSLESIHSPDALPLLNLTLFHPFEELQSLNLSSGYFKGWFDKRQGLDIRFHFCSCIQVPLQCKILYRFYR